MLATDRKRRLRAIGEKNLHCNRLISRLVEIGIVHTLMGTRVCVGMETVRNPEAKNKNACKRSYINAARRGKKLSLPVSQSKTTSTLVGPLIHKILIRGTIEVFDLSSGS